MLLILAWRSAFLPHSLRPTTAAGTPTQFVLNVWTYFLGGKADEVAPTKARCHAQRGTKLSFLARCSRSALRSRPPRWRLGAFSGAPQGAWSVRTRHEVSTRRFTPVSSENLIDRGWRRCLPLPKWLGGHVDGRTNDAGDSSRSVRCFP
ncbi:hypothetical protein DFH06DRAFT_1167706 [Mycena polygramma]|nr:hypothetical protein DFH06DRAFT_1167706 [Mycena polygramma]